jgi:hypothetical protein
MRRAMLLAFTSFALDDIEVLEVPVVPEVGVEPTRFQGRRIFLLLRLSPPRCNGLPRS